ncbi:RING/U-box superfamily protein [Abeliophyllum distichum]|uniref:RING-type E3 ubiquitin transferase n=1 Tax=Abeliophyllum distichum TaxID=126358 RepID=A0ABD1USL3_9LAMI
MNIVLHLVAGQNECLPTRCGDSSPVIRFPFRLKDHQPDCGYIRFELLCINSRKIEFELQFPVTASTNNTMLPLKVKVSVVDIDYKAQTILISDLIAESCFLNKLPTVNSSASPFDTEKSGYSDGFTLFNCSKPTDYGYPLTCLSGQDYHVIVLLHFMRSTPCSSTHLVLRCTTFHIFQKARLQGKM